MSKQYRQGRRCEYEIVKHFPRPRFVSQRTAGSHSPFDVIVWDRKEKTVSLIQVKKIKRETLSVLKALRKEYESARSFFKHLPIGVSFEFWVRKPGKRNVVNWKDNWIAWGE